MCSSSHSDDYKDYKRTRRPLQKIEETFKFPQHAISLALLSYIEVTQAFITRASCEREKCTAEKS